MIIIILFIAIYVAGILSIIFEPNPFNIGVSENPKREGPLWLHYYYIGVAILFCTLVLAGVASILGIFL